MSRKSELTIVTVVVFWSCFFEEWQIVTELKFGNLCARKPSKLNQRKLNDLD